MARFKVKILRKVQEDLIDTVEYLNTLSPQAALRYYDLLTEKISGLSEMPERCASVRDEQLRLRGYRFMIVENYTVFFVIENDTVQIRRILHYRRQYEHLL
ncbi:MAG: type II toxin-antitoxin system RelE/ParE family toxin [Clostridiales Family XIII bacterium]|jgi:plasmid stabilization system protein ParE|nr:type II toxin-antitoxin system RelE/ParE family toxin [Clostridiales Family XIII bacterium]